MGMFILAVIVLIIAVIIYFGVHNGKLMDNSIESGLNILKQHYTVTEAPEDDFSTITLYGIMKFHTKRYDIDGLGNLCVMTVNIGLMQMLSFVITPYEKNMPLMSLDFIYIFSSRKCYMETYDLVSDAKSEEYLSVLSVLRNTFDSYSDLEDIVPSSGWYDYLLTVKAYKSAKSSQDSRVSQMFSDIVEAYALSSAALTPLTGEAKAEKLALTQTYCNNLVEKGGTSTDMFKKALGNEFTSDFFNKVFFGPANYQEKQ